MMRSAIIIVMLLAAPLSRAQDAASLQRFDEGTTALIEGRFQDALGAFETIQRSGWESDALYYNMALAHYRLDNLGQAIRFLEKARQLNEDDPRILHSLAIAGQRQADRFSTLPDPFWLSARAWLTDQVPIRTAFLIGILCWFGFAAAWLANVVGGVNGPGWQRGRSVGFVLGLVLITHAFASSIWPPHPDRHVILADVSQLREQASLEAAEVVEVHEGLIVDVRASAPAWYLVEIPNGTRGWVPSADLGDI